MDDERPIEESPEVPDNQDSDAGEMDTLVMATNDSQTEGTDTLIQDSNDSETGEMIAPVPDTSDYETEEKGSSSGKGLLIGAGIVLIVILIIAGLLLPPISLIDRLFGGGDEETMAEATPVGAELEGEEVPAEEFDVSVNAAISSVEISSVSQSEFQSGTLSEDWSAAATAMPDNLVLSSDVYAIGYEGDPPVGTINMGIPAEAQPFQTLDLYGWDGQSWRFIASDVSDNSVHLTSTETPLPMAAALMQTQVPTEVSVGAELLPGQSLPSAVLPHLTEVTVGTLTLVEDGELMGEVIPAPTGGYAQLLRATNTGAIVDTVSLTSLLTSDEAQQKNIQQLVDKSKAGNFNGVNLDYQGVDAVQTEAFTSFVGNLAGALHQENLLLVVTLETPVQNGGLWDSAGQDWVALGQIADGVYAQMPLDPTAYGDGGIAEEFLVWATRQVDRGELSSLISVNAIDVVGESYLEVPTNQALADFGEITLVTESDKVEPGEQVEVALSGSADALEWDPTGLTYKYGYELGGQPHEIWLANEALLSHRARLPNRFNLRGIAARGLGNLDEGAGYAAAIQSYLGSGDAPQPASASIMWGVEDEAGALVASSSGESLTYIWEGSEIAGPYMIKADFAQGDNLAPLGSLPVTVAEAPTPTPVPTEAPVVEATPTVAVAAASDSANPGDADAASTVPANLRDGPGLSYGKIGGLVTGEQVSLIGRNEGADWLQITKEDSTEGWVFAELLTLNSSVDVNGLEVVEVEPPVSAGGDGDGGAAAPPPVIVPSAGGIFELGGQTHGFANPALMSASGMNWVKFQHKWGQGDQPNAVQGRIDSAHANGFKVLLSIPGANAYPSSIEFGSYVTFLGGVAALGPDAIEVWNEENIDFEWPAGQIDPAAYVNNMLAPAYNAIKAANPNVMVVSGAPAPTGFDNNTNAWADDRYMAGVAAAGGANYMDCIGVHHNAGATSPSAVSGHPAGGTHYSWYFGPTLNMYYNAFGGARPVCFTELGYLSGEDFGGVPSRFSWAANTTVGQHANWLAEAASLSANSGQVRLLIVFNVDFTTWGEDPQAGYAMMRPNGGCPSCDLLKQVMGG